MKFTDKKKVWSLRYTPGNSEVDAKIESLAAELGVSHATVLRIAHSHNFPLLKDYTERNKAILEALKTKSIVDVAKEFNLSQQRIWTIKETFKG